MATSRNWLAGIHNWSNMVYAASARRCCAAISLLHRKWRDMSATVMYSKVSQRFEKKNIPTCNSGIGKKLTASHLLKESSIIISSKTVFSLIISSKTVWGTKAELSARVGRPQTSSSPQVIFIVGRPKAALLFWFFGDFRCGALLFIVIHVIYKYKNR